MLTAKAQALLERVRSRYKPPPRLKLSKWAEEHIALPAGQSARPGRYRNWPYFREILDSMADPDVEQVTVVKPTRVGFTKGIVVAIAAVAATNPCPAILVVPTDEDARDYAVDEIDPVFETSAELEDSPLKGIMREGRLANGRNTLTRKSFLGGGSLKILAARAPRNLRRHDAKYMFADEVDGMEITKEGDPIAIAKRRTMAHADRKIIMGSTPTEEGVSIIEKEYAKGDQRHLLIRCPHCKHQFEIMRTHLQMDGPDKAVCVCPGSGCVIEERDKLRLVQAAEWVPLFPERKSHRSYRMNSFVSLLANANWVTLLKEWDDAKRGGPAEMQVYVNTVEGRAWKTSINSVSAEALAERVEPFGLTLDQDGNTRIPPWVLMITVGVDVQDDRLEITVLGWGLPTQGAKVYEPGPPTVLGHYQIDGNTLDDATWAELDAFLRTTWRHPNGWRLRIDAAAIDSGGSEGRTQKVYDFCGPRLARRIYAIKGDPGAKPIWRPSSSKKIKGGSRLFLIGHDMVKTTVMERLGRPLVNDDGEVDPHAARFSEDLEMSWFEQVTGETRRIRYVRNRSVIEFQPKSRGQRVEALDCMCYAYAVRFAKGVKALNLQERAARLPEPVVVAGQLPAAKRPKGGGWASMFNE